MPDQPEDAGDDLSEVDDDWSSEPTGSCDDCGCNVYDDDAVELDDRVLCDQCAWYVAQTVWD